MANARNLFQRNRRTSPELCSLSFQRGLRELVLYRDRKGGLPPVSARGTRGFPVGKWLLEQRMTPHNLSESERAMLLAIPGVHLGVGSRPVHLNIHTSAQRALWQRLVRWAHNPSDDPVSDTWRKLMKRQAMKKRKRQQAS